MTIAPLDTGRLAGTGVALPHAGPLLAKVAELIAQSNALAAQAADLERIAGDLASRTHAPVADLDALRAVPAADLTDRMLIHCEALGLFRYDAESEAADDGERVIAPTAVGAGAGRFLRLALPTEEPAASAAWPEVLFVRHGSTAPAPDGSLEQPFATIQAALDTIAPPVDAADERRRFVILIAPGQYDEDLAVPPARNIALLGLGSWALGDGAGQYHASTTPRHITWAQDATKEFSQSRPTLIIGTLLPAETSSTHVAYAGGADISGNLVITDALGTTHELHLYGVKVRGSVDGTAALGQMNTYVRRGYFVGAFNAPHAHLNVIESAEFDAVIVCNTYGRFAACEVVGMTCSGPNSYLPPTGFFGCEMSGPYTLAGALNLDGVSNHRFKASGATIAGGGAKVIIDDLTP